MKIVLHTQHRENYGAHDWDGEGECPQYWKSKGGSTYVVHGVTVAQAQCAQFWESLYVAVESSNESFQEYVIGDLLIDDVDYVESDHVEDWDSPINLAPVGGNANRQWLATRLREADIGWQKGIKSTLEQWKQVRGSREEFKLMVFLEDGRSLTHQEWLAEQEAA